MSFIDPEGMFGGDRMAMLSDKTRWVWPWLWCASNGAGRLELNFRTISERAFRQFKTRPTEEQFSEWIKEFNECYLLFVYQTESGQLWGQWNVTDKYLPRFKKKADSESPAPNVRSMLEWNRQYEALKKQSTLAKFRISNVGKAESVPVDDSAQKGRRNRPKKAEDGPKKADSCKPLVITTEKADLDTVTKFCEITLDVDVDVDVDETTKPSCPAKTAGQAERPSKVSKQRASTEVAIVGGELPSTSRPKIRGKQKTSSQDAWIIESHGQFYAAYWRRVKKQKSFEAYTRRIAKMVAGGMCRDAAAGFLLEQAAEDRRRFEPTRDWSWRQNLHPSSWLNGEMWTDEAPPPDASVIVRQPPERQVRRSEVVAGLNLVNEIRRAQ